jgi:hypothetical protein
MSMATNQALVSDSISTAANRACPAANRPPLLVNLLTMAVAVVTCWSRTAAMSGPTANDGRAAE